MNKDIYIDLLRNYPPYGDEFSIKAYLLGVLSCATKDPSIVQDDFNEILNVFSEIKTEVENFHV